MKPGQRRTDMMRIVCLLFVLMVSALPAWAQNAFVGYLAAGTGTGTFTEETGGGYARQAITFGPLANGATSNTAGATFGPATGAAWPTITEQAIYDAATGGNLIAWWPLATPQTVAPGGTAPVAQGGIHLRLTDLAGVASGSPAYAEVWSAGTVFGMTGASGTGMPVTAGANISVAAGVLSVAPLPPVGTTAGTVAAGNDPRLLGAVQSSLIGTPNGVAALDGTGSLLLRPTANSLTQGISLQQSGAGTATAAQFPESMMPHAGFAYAYQQITSDNVFVDPSQVGRQIAFGNVIDYHFGGSNANGPRIALGAFATQTAQMQAGDTSFLGSIWSFMLTSSPSGGSAAAPQGGLFAINPQVQAAPGALYWQIIEGDETDVEVDTGASVTDKFGINITTIGNDAVHASDREAALHIGAVPTSGGWRTGILFSNYSGSGLPIAANGSLMSTISIGTVLNGIDLSAAAFTGSAFKSPGFSVDGAGNTTLGSLVVGTGTVLPSNSTGHFLQLPYTNGAPTGVPAGIAGAPCEWNDTSHTLNCYSPGAAGWYHLSLTAGAG